MYVLHICVRCRSVCRAEPNKPFSHFNPTSSVLYHHIKLIISVTGSGV
jgi:hypothetical protein